MTSGILNTFLLPTAHTTVVRISLLAGFLQSVSNYKGALCIEVVLPKLIGGTRKLSGESKPPGSRSILHSQTSRMRGC